MITHNQPRFTVAITVWQRPNLVLRAFLSVLRQSYPNWDCMFVSDGPTPRARDIIDEFLVTLPATVGCYVRWHERERRPGCWGNHLRRWALEQAQGDYTVILGHDCELFPDYLEEAARLDEVFRNFLILLGTHVWSDRVLGQPDARLPRPEYLGVWPPVAPVEQLKPGQVDLTGMVFPTARARALDCFAEEDWPRYAADYLAYRRLVDGGVRVVANLKPRAAHF